MRGEVAEALGISITREIEIKPYGKAIDDDNFN